MEDKIIFRAYCTSWKCTVGKKKFLDRSSRGILKIVSRDAWFCPDCRSALYWQKETESGKRFINHYIVGDQEAGKRYWDN